MTGLAGLLLLSPLKQVRLVLQVASPVMKNDRKSDESIDNLIYILYVSVWLPRNVCFHMDFHLTTNKITLIIIPDITVKIKHCTCFSTAIGVLLVAICLSCSLAYGSVGTILANETMPAWKDLLIVVRIGRIILKI